MIVDIKIKCTLCEFKDQKELFIKDQIIDLYESIENDLKTYENDKCPECGSDITFDLL